MNTEKLVSQEEHARGWSLKVGAAVTVGVVRTWKRCCGREVQSVCGVELVRFRCARNYVEYQLSRIFDARSIVTDVANLMGSG